MPILHVIERLIDLVIHLVFLVLALHTLPIVLLDGFAAAIEQAINGLLQGVVIVVFVCFVLVVLWRSARVATVAHGSAGSAPTLVDASLGTHQE